MIQFCFKKGYCFKNKPYYLLEESHFKRTPNHSSYTYVQNVLRPVKSIVLYILFAITSRVLENVLTAVQQKFEGQEVLST